jgi:hypothetical protein
MRATAGTKGGGMPKIKATTTTEFDLSVETAAVWFADLGDEEQAQFFIEVAKVAETWTHSAMQQWYMVGRHLRTCSCSTPEARAMIEDIASGVREPR